MESFSEIFILNLHGRSKPAEAGPNGSGNENVFDIQQGVAILLAVRKPGHKGSATVRYADLWGLTLLRVQRYRMKTSGKLTSKGKVPTNIRTVIAEDGN